jgi:polar amino acid transport system permease protein
MDDLLRGSAQPGVAPLLADITAARRRQQRSYRVIFALTWVVLVGVVIVLVGQGFDLAFLGTWWNFIARGATTTVLLAVASISLAVVLALLGAVGRLSANPVFNASASLYVSLIRGTPLLVQVIFWFLAAAELGLVLPLFWVGVLALGINYGAYMTEIFRAGIQAVPRGQSEAAAALGMGSALTFRRIVFPQAFRIVVPAIGNEFIAMIKDTALVSVISVTELLFNAQAAGRPRVRILEAVAFAALVYWILTIVFSFFQDRLERRLARSDR